MINSGSTNISNLQNLTNFTQVSPQFEKVHFFLQRVNLPGIASSPEQISARGRNRIHLGQDTLEFSPLQFEMLIDENLSIWLEFQDTIREMVKRDGTFDVTPFDFIVTINNNKGNPLFKIHYEDCRLTNIGDLQLDTTSNLAHHTMMVEIMYDQYEIVHPQDTKDPKDAQGISFEEARYLEVLECSTPYIKSEPTPTPISYGIVLSSPAVYEGQESITISQRTDKDIQDALFVFLDNSQIIEISPLSKAGSVTFPNTKENTPYTDQQTLILNIMDVQGSEEDLENLDVSQSLTIEIKNKIDTTKIVLDDVTIDEGDDITIFASVSNPTKKELVITLSNNFKIFIPQGESEGSVTFDYLSSGIEGPYGEISIKETRGGGFESLDIFDVQVVSVIFELEPITVYMRTDDVLEGEDINVSISLSSEPVEDVVVLLGGEGLPSQEILIPRNTSEMQYTFENPVSQSPYKDARILVYDVTTLSDYPLTIPQTLEVNVLDKGDDVTYVTISFDKIEYLEEEPLEFRIDVSNLVTKEPLVVTIYDEMHDNNNRHDGGGFSDIVIEEGSNSFVFYDEAIQLHSPYSNTVTTWDVSITDVQGGNFEAIDFNSSASVLIHNEIYTPTQLRLDGTDVYEGEDITITQTLDFEVTEEPFVVVLDNGEEITIPLGETQGSITFENPIDYSHGVDQTSLYFYIESYSGGNFSDVRNLYGLVIRVLDKDTPTTVTLSGSDVFEGDPITIIANVDNPTIEDLTLYLSNSEEIVIPIGQTQGSVTFTNPYPDTPYLDSIEYTVSIDSYQGGGYYSLDYATELTISIKDTIDVSTATLSNSEDLEAITYYVNVDNPPLSDINFLVTLNTSETITITVMQGLTSGEGVLSLQDLTHEETFVLSVQGFEVVSYQGEYESLVLSDLSTPITIEPSLEVDWDVQVEFTQTPNGGMSYKAIEGVQVPGEFGQDINGDWFYIQKNKQDLRNICGRFNNLSNNATIDIVDDKSVTKNIPLNNVVTTFITDMGHIEYDGAIFHGLSMYQYIGNWDVSNVTNMRQMFLQSSFNQDISGWDVSNVQMFTRMFEQQSSFDQDLSRWDVSSARNMGYMFGWASSFNQDISGWDVSNVNVISPGGDAPLDWMFIEAYQFDQDLSGWCVQDVNGDDVIFAFGSGIENEQYFPKWGEGCKVCPDGSKHHTSYNC